MEGFSFVTPVTGLNRPNTRKEDDYEMCEFYGLMQMWLKKSKWSRQVFFPWAAYCCSDSKDIFPLYINPTSLPCSQKHTTDPHPEPYKSVPHSYTLHLTRDLAEWNPPIRLQDSSGHSPNFLAKYYVSTLNSFFVIHNFILQFLHHELIRLIVRAPVCNRPYLSWQRASLHNMYI
jgi:hypothetical protein